MPPDTGRAEPALTSLRELVRHVGHDLNNHLASIIVNLSLASSTTASETERLTQLREALDAARHAAQLARQLFAAGTDGEPVATAEETASQQANTAPLDSSLDVSDDVGYGTESTMDGDAEAEVAGTAGSLLVLEDDESVATMMKDVLRHFGYDVAVTQSPETCVVLYDQARSAGRPFDLVVLDLTIRGGSRRGIDTLAALRLMDPTVRAVAHSGDPEADIMKDPLRYGFVGAIRKPTPLAQLSRIVQNLIAKDA
jgi:CheY-like chemotaxis protein